jgi:flavin reductase
MRRLCAGVSLITTSHEGTPYGLIVTSATALTGEPPTLLVCVNKQTSSHDPLIKAGIFCVNLLTEHDENVAGQFSSSARRHERFQDANWTTLVTGAPVYRGALATFDCAVDRIIPYETHSIVIGAIKAVHLTDDKADPLLYLGGRYRRIQRWDVAAIA